MRIESVHLGDACPKNRNGQAFVTRHCVTARLAGYACLSCRKTLLTGYRLLEHCGEALTIEHAIAERCDACGGFHPIAHPRLLPELRAAAQMWPLAPESVMLGAEARP